MNKKNLRIYIFLLIFIIIFLIFIDLINITQYIPFSEKYDWLGVGAAIIGGILGAIATLIGVNQTIQYEKKRDKDKEIENRKNNYYSYLSFNKETLKITLSLDSITGINNDIHYQNVLIGENVKADNAYYFEIELSFDVLNNIFPSSVIINNLTLVYNEKTVDNKTTYNDLEYFTKYNSDYKKITIKNGKTIAFAAKCLIN